MRVHTSCCMCGQVPGRCCGWCGSGSGNGGVGTFKIGPPTSTTPRHHDDIALTRRNANTNTNTNTVCVTHQGVRSAVAMQSWRTTCRCHGTCRWLQRRRGGGSGGGSGGETMVGSRDMGLAWWWWQQLGHGSWWMAVRHGHGHGHGHDHGHGCGSGPGPGNNHRHGEWWAFGDATPTAVVGCAHTRIVRCDMRHECRIMVVPSVALHSGAVGQPDAGVGHASAGHIMTSETTWHGQVCVRGGCTLTMHADRRLRGMAGTPTNATRISCTCAVLGLKRWRRGRGGNSATFRVPAAVVQADNVTTGGTRLVTRRLADAAMATRCAVVIRVKRLTVAQEHIRSTGIGRGSTTGADSAEHGTTTLFI